MTLAACCMSHTPLLEVTDPGPGLTADVETAFATARDLVRDCDPETGDRVRPGRHRCGSCIGDGIVGARVRQKGSMT